LDEWFNAVGRGDINPSAGDEVRASAKNPAIKNKELLEKAKGKAESVTGLLHLREKERGKLEDSLKSQVAELIWHEPSMLKEVRANWNDAQKKISGTIGDTIKGLTKIDREMAAFFNDLKNAMDDVAELRRKIEADGGEVVDNEMLSNEFKTVRQMARMTIGRQGNAFPFLSAEYFTLGPIGVGSRENIAAMLAKNEAVDPEAFVRVFKGQSSRILPNVILLPTYGDDGICWEPYERTNRAASRGRIAVPMYPKNLQLAVFSAVGDLRWQVAKESAGGYWMEEGLTGAYYRYFNDRKMKGDVKVYFIQDYILWVTKECDGIQRLDKEIRGMFWRYMPFSQELKEKLKVRSPIYAELYQRDMNRAKSDL
jgi:hypothetical protein